MDAESDVVLSLILSEWPAGSAAPVERIRARVLDVMGDLDWDDLNSSAWQVSETILAEFSADPGVNGSWPTVD